MPILLPELVIEATSLGAAIAGGVGVGIFADFAVTDRFIRASVAAQPNPATEARYAELVPLLRVAYATWNRSSVSCADLPFPPIGI
jgi:xylulokinase